MSGHATCTASCTSFSTTAASPFDVTCDAASSNASAASRNSLPFAPAVAGRGIARVAFTATAMAALAAATALASPGLRINEETVGLRGRVRGRVESTHSTMEGSGGGPIYGRS